MLAYLGDLGGLFEISWIVGAFLTGLITRNALKAALISDSYQIQKYGQDNSEYYTTKRGTKKNLLTSESESVSEEEDNPATEFKSIFSQDKKWDDLD